MKKSKKILSTLLVLCMILTLAPTLSTPAHAAMAITNISSRTLTQLVVGYDSEDKETTTYTLQNCGDIAFTTLQVQLSGANPFDFLVTLQPTVILAPGETRTLTVVANDGLAVGTYSVDVSVIANGVGATGCTVTQVVSEPKGTQEAPSGLSSTDSDYGTNNGKITGTTTAMQYKLSTSADTAYEICTDAEVTGLAPAVYSVRYAETASLAASYASNVLIGEIAGGLTVDLAPLGTPEAGKVQLTITDSVPTDGNLYYAINSSSYIGGIPCVDSPTTLAGLTEYTDTTTITVADGQYVHAFKVFTVDSTHYMKRYGLSAASNDGFQGTQEAPSTLSSDNSNYNANDGVIYGTTAEMDYKLSTDIGYTACTGTEITGLTPGTYYVRYAATGDYLASDDTEITIKEKAGELTVDLVPLGTPEENKMQLTITPYTPGNIYYLIKDSTYSDVTTNTLIDIDGMMLYTESTTIDITDGMYVNAYMVTDDAPYYIQKYGMSVVSNDGAKGTQEAPTLIRNDSSHYNANDGRLYDLTTAMQYKLHADTAYIDCNGTEVTGLAPGIYDVRYKETDTLSAGEVANCEIDEIAGGLTVTLAPLSPVQDNKMLLTIDEDDRLLDGTIYYMITDDISMVGQTTIGDGGDLENSYFNSMFHEYTEPVEIEILDSYYVVAYKLVTATNGENTDTTFNKCGASLEADDTYTQEEPSGLTAVNAIYGSTEGKIAGTTTAMEYKLESEEEKDYQPCSDTETSGLEVGTYVVRYMHTEDETESPEVVITIEQAAGGLTVTLTPLNPAQDNKLQLTITEDEEADGVTYYFIFNDDTVKVPPVGQQVTASKRTELSFVEYTAPITITVPDGSYVYVVKGTLEETILTTTKFGASILTSDGYTPPTGGGTSAPASNEVSGTVGDTTKPVGTSDDTTNSDGKTVTIVKIDQDKIDSIIKDSTIGNKIVIPTNSKSDVVQGQLNGQTVKNMEAKEAVLEIKTGNTTYTLPASQINIDSISAQMGKDVALKDIIVNIQISNASSSNAQIVADTANRNNYQVIAKPVEFEITCTSGNKTVDVSKFNGYVERTVAIPDGIDPTKITTGIVLNADGTFKHVPTTIVKLDGKYYAKINSLTNSTYSVIYNPVKFADVAGYWAENAINDMGSRLVVTGIDSNTYAPLKDITRAEFATIIVRALGLTKNTVASTFKDVVSTDWYNGYVATAVEYGLITGYDTTTFGPNDKITREQAMVIIARAMKIAGLKSNVSDVANVLKAYTDSSAISSYAQSSVADCINTGVINGRTSSTVDSKANITRAEVAVITQRLLIKSNLINS